MKATFLNVGYGDCILLQNENGYISLIDGGSDLESEFSGDQYRIRAIDFLKSQQISHLNAVFISHIHEDHVCGLEKVLNSVTADVIYTPYPLDVFTGARPLTPLPDAARSVPLYTAALNAFVRILRHAEAQGTPVRTLKAGSRLQLTDQISAQVLTPRNRELQQYTDRLRRIYASDSTDTEITELLTLLDATSNQTSMLLKITDGRNVLLDAADSCPNVWSEVPVSALQNVNVLKLPHHGQRDCVDENMMKQMPLKYVVTTSASDRRYNSANAEVYGKLTSWFPERPIQFLFTDEREYPPYFSQPDGFRALTLLMNSNGIQVEFVK